MRVQVHPCDRGGCGHYRLRFPVAALQAAGHDVTIAEEINGVCSPLLPGHTLRALVDADVVVLQRPLAQAMCELIPVLQRQGVAVVVEIDDDFHALPPGHGAKAATSVSANPTHNRRWLRKACELADLVTVTTAPLAERYAPHGRFAVLPNLVPAAYLEVPGHEPRAQAPWLGWTGSVVTHVGDLDVLGGVVPGVLESTGARFSSWGVGYTEEALGVKGRVRPWAELTGPYPRQVADLDVGMVPLVDNTFNRAKSWLKGLEYAALGVPFVASPLPEYQAIDELLPAALLASTPAEWAASLTRLLTSPQVRQDVAGANREAVAAMTYEQHADRWWTAWAAAADHAAQRHGAAA